MGKEDTDVGVRGVGEGVLGLGQPLGEREEVALDLVHLETGLKLKYELR